MKNIPYCDDGSTTFVQGNSPDLWVVWLMSLQCIWVNTCTFCLRLSPWLQAFSLMWSVFIYFSLFPDAKDKRKGSSFFYIWVLTVWSGARRHIFQNHLSCTNSTDTWLIRKSSCLPFLHTAVQFSPRDIKEPFNKRKLDTDFLHSLETLANSAVDSHWSGSLP